MVLSLLKRNNLDSVAVLFIYTTYRVVSSVIINISWGSHDNMQFMFTQLCYLFRNMNAIFKTRVWQSDKYNYNRYLHPESNKK